MEEQNIIKPLVNMATIKENYEYTSMDPPKLSPTPRKSERERKNISYDKLNKGGADSDDEEYDSKDPAGNKIKKIDVKKSNYVEINRKVQDMLETMKKHEHSHLFNLPINKNHPLYNEICANYTTLSMIDLHFKIGDKYKNTDEIATEFRNMIMTKMKMSMNGGESNEYQNI